MLGWEACAPMPLSAPFPTMLPDPAPCPEQFRPGLLEEGASGQVGNSDTTASREWEGSGLVLSRPGSPTDRAPTRDQEKTPEHRSRPWEDDPRVRAFGPPPGANPHGPVRVQSPPWPCDHLLWMGPDPSGFVGDVPLHCRHGG